MSEAVGLLPPKDQDAAVVAQWTRSAAEADRWCSVAMHPFPPERVQGWWADADVQPWLLVEGPAATSVGYGELWLDVAEDEVELARLIIDPARRRTGLGRQLVARLVGAAEQTGLSACLLRVVPDNLPARALYAAAGFVEVDAERTAEWNDGQPTAYVWMEWPGFGTALAPRRDEPGLRPPPRWA
jgi:ribosomal-protein-alanine N-acetyltransferase